MKKRLAIGEVRKLIQESADEFNAVFGNNYNASKESKENTEAYKEIANETAKLGEFKPKKASGTSVMADDNKGMTDLQYDGEVPESFKKRVSAQLKGYDSEQAEKAHKNEPLGNGDRGDDRIEKALKKKAKEVKDKTDDLSSKGITAGQKNKKENARHEDNIAESKGTPKLRFKRVMFISESHMLSHVPDDYKVNGKKFYMEDCKGNKYLVEWGKDVEVEKMINESKQKAEFERMKKLFNYQPKSSKSNNTMRMNEERDFQDMLGKARKLIK